MKKKLIIGIAVGFVLATIGRVVYAGNEGNLAKILEAGVEGLKAYFDFLLDVLKVIW